MKEMEKEFGQDEFKDLKRKIAKLTLEKKLRRDLGNELETVSYTHLTLPTNREV